MKIEETAWCPGCGNFAILNILKEALAELNVDQKNLVMVSGIGQAAKLPQYLKCNYFNGLHGRALPPATAIKAVNPELLVIAESGDGDTYGEGGNHFIHTIRRNPNITNIVHNNMVYALTKGQPSPTADNFNPLAAAIALDASFVARAFCGDLEKTKEIFKKAIQHKGYALVDVFQPCVTFNKTNTFKWFKEHTYYLDSKHDPQNRVEAFRRAIELEKLPLGVFYINPNKITFEEKLPVYKANKTPLTRRLLSKRTKLQKLLESFL